MGCKVYSGEGTDKQFAGESAFDTPEFAVFDVAMREWGTLPGTSERYIAVNSDGDGVAFVVEVEAADAKVVLP